METNNKNKDITIGRFKFVIVPDEEITTFEEELELMVNDFEADLKDLLSEEE